MRILITGATSGIGRQLALDYHRDNHQVWALGRNQKALDELSAEGLQAVRMDLEDRDMARDWFTAMTPIDLAILNAGSCEYVDLPQFDSELVSRVMRSNVESMAVSIEGVLPLLRQGERPHLVAVGSSAAYLPLSRAEAYGASKAAIEYMIRTLRIDIYREKIDVSLVCPGFVKTPLTDRNEFPMPFRLSVEEAADRIRRGIEKRRLEIHFPKRFTFILKALSLIPEALWLRISQRMVNNER
ncbi:SDR family NAD(P)-dependent oxidoreductase [Thermodesulfobacteriota bacterium]